MIALGKALHKRATMKSHRNPILPLLCFCFVLNASATFPALADEGHKLLFSQTKASLPETDQRAIYARLDLTMSPDETGLGFKGLECPPFMFNEVAVTDLDGDGQQEIIARGGNTCTSGGNGSSIWLLTKSTAGNWDLHLGFPSGGYTVIAEKHQGFPDLQFGGMGWCESVWRWDGATYQHFKNVATQPGGCDQPR